MTGSIDVHGAAGSRRTWRDGAEFWLVGGLLGLLMFASSAPSPLYGLYATRWHFSASALTAVFAVYALALLAALLVGGRLSDHVGRRPVILASLAVEGAAMACFLVAQSVDLLYVARILQGAATGLATGALSAALIDLQPEGRVALAPIVNSSAPSFGLAIGALVTSVLVQYGPSPLRLIYWVLMGIFALGLLGVVAMREPGVHRSGALGSLRPTVSVPAEVRGVFAFALPCLIALWALGGLYLSLGPSLVSELVSSNDVLWGGLVIFLLTGVGFMASVLLRSWDPSRATFVGCLVLLAGIGVTLGAIATKTASLFLVGTAIAGFGFGSAFLGVFRLLSSGAAPDQRAGLIATIYIASYLAFSIPAVVAGIAVTDTSLRSTAIVYAAALVGLVGMALLGFAGRRRNQPVERGATAGHVDPPPSPCTLPPCFPAPSAAAAR